ncbi:hypothetical protein DPMN_177654 [Dreissena polymorpha]|uniref:Tyrosinase copper-binding domain-containing protein n=2 Tax=Dreissena polymorpha TaxID=45954 RepID=A0A9D4EC14_DREPO|nr:hypothetical protein DPMN_177654 [Dreissena polymorpha]
MRKIDNTVSLPYWDSRLDYAMSGPATTILFSTYFFGNGFGLVTTGPFANWDAGSFGKLRRNIGGDSKLFSRDDIRAVLKRCKTSEITFPTATLKTDFEYFHGGPHNWVGGQMSGLDSSSTAYGKGFASANQLNVNRRLIPS